MAVAACGTGDSGTGTTPTPTGQETMSASKRAIANLLPAGAVPPAPPGDTLVDAMGPVEVTGVIGEPSRQVMTCTPLELLMDDPGPAEPDAARAASSGFLTGVAQVDQYAVVYTDEAAAQRAVARSRDRAQDCQAAFAVHSPDADAEAIVSKAPDGVDGFRVHATYAYDDTGYSSDEFSAVLRFGSTVLYLRANEAGSPEGMNWETDGILDPDWSDQLVTAAAAHLTE
ncbi:MAG: sensor domain-containing protein [Candidatus Nanopelagicales bacterium]